MPRSRLAMPIVTTVLAGAIVAGCSGSSAGLFTSSNKSDATGAPALIVMTPNERAAHAATISAEASKCGYNFDPAKVRSGYLSYEAAQGLQPDDVAKLEKIYDNARGKLFSVIGKAEDFCSEERTEKIKRELAKQLAGDFAGPMKRPPPPTNMWGAPTSSDKFDRDKALHPAGRV